MDNHLKNCEGIQFNGWNFAHICDWMLDTSEKYYAEYFDEIYINGNKVKRHDWIVKNDNGTFTIMTNNEYLDWITSKY